MLFTIKSFCKYRKRDVQKNKIVLNWNWISSISTAKKVENFWIIFANSFINERLSLVTIFTEKII